MALQEEVALSELVQWTEKQSAAWHELNRDDVQFLLYGGARGPGKSYFLRWALLGLLLRWAAEGMDAQRVGLFCETYVTLKDRQIRFIKQEFPLWLGKVKSTQEEGLGFYVEPKYGGGVILLRNLDDPEKYKSAEFAAIAVDELTMNPFNTFETLRGSKRSTLVPVTKFLGATNPGGIGHLWVKALWVDKDFSGFPQLAPRKEQFVFVRGLLEDNPHLGPEYEEEIESIQDDQLRRAWRYGDWDVFAGQVFSEWRYGDPVAGDGHVIEPFRIPSHWQKWRSMDWGYAKPWCTHWWAQDPDSGRLYIYREAYGIGLTDRAQARLIRRVTNEEISHSFGDPSCWAKKNVNDVVTSTADEYAKEGVPLIKGDNDRLNGKRKVHDALANLPDGRPGLQVFRTCKNLIRTLPALPYDKTRVEDVDTDAEDHAYDSMRYGLTVRKRSDDRRPDPASERWMRSVMRARGAL